MSLGSVTLPALGTTATICVTRERALDRARAVMEQELAETDVACSRFRSDSELARLNAAGGRPVTVSARLLAAIEVALQAAVASEGLVDPTVGRTLRLAGYDHTFEVVRGREGASFHARFCRVPGWTEVNIDWDKRTVQLPRGCELDLGATAKAFAADQIAQRAAALVGGGVLVSLGGDVAVAGEPPTEGWVIRLADDHTAPFDGPGPTISICAGGLASSSTTVRRWRAGDIELHHIVDPRTGKPAETPWQMVSVAASSCLDANIAATTAIVLGPPAVEWLGRRQLPARLVGRTGRIVHVAGWPGQ